MKIALIDDDLLQLEDLKSQFRGFRNFEIIHAANYQQGEGLVDKIINGELEVDFTICDKHLNPKILEEVGTQLARTLKEANHLVITWSGDDEGTHTEAGHYFFSKFNLYEMLELISSKEFGDRITELKHLRGNEVRFN